MFTKFPLMFFLKLNLMVILMLLQTKLNSLEQNLFGQQQTVIALYVLNKKMYRCVCMIMGRFRFTPIVTGHRENTRAEAQRPKQASENDKKRHQNAKIVYGQAWACVI